MDTDYASLDEISDALGSHDTSAEAEVNTDVDTEA